MNSNPSKGGFRNYDARGLRRETSHVVTERIEAFLTGRQEFWGPTLMTWRYTHNEPSSHSFFSIASLILSPLPPHLHSERERHTTSSTWKGWLGTIKY